MTADSRLRIVAYQWWPEGDEADSPMAAGKLYFTHRDDPGDVWSPPIAIGTMPLAQARSLASGEGFPIEVVSS